VGEEVLWYQAEAALEAALNAKDLDWDLQPGEGAFYGPKIEFSLRDAIGRVWQLGTIQLDFSMPERLGAHYVDEDGERKAPVMLHRAILGSLERFIGILIEQYTGNLPFWLAPVQAVVINITDRQSERAQDVAKTLQNQGFRVQTDLRNEKIGFKIREHTLKHIPYMLILGDREIETNTIAVRLRNGEDLGSLPLETVIARFQEHTAQRN